MLIVPNFHVLLAVAALPERLRTNRARVWLFSCMDAVMVLQRIRPEKLLLAGLQKKPIPFLNPITHFHSLALFLSPHLALVSPFAPVNQAMLIEHGSRQEPFAADQTLVGTLMRMELPHVIIQVGSNREAALTPLHRAFEWLHSGMETQMLPQVAGLRVRLAAHIAQVLATPGQRCCCRRL